MALDFIGINHYTSYYVQDCIYSPCEPGITGVTRTEGLYQQSSERNGVRIGESFPVCIALDLITMIPIRINLELSTLQCTFLTVQSPVEWLNVYPQGMEKMVTYVVERYNNTPIFITENGKHIYSGHGHGHG